MSSNLNTIDYIKKFYKLFERYDFYCNSFYIEMATNICKFIGCTHSKTGYRILIDIPEELQIEFDRNISSTIDNIIMIEKVQIDNLDVNVDDLFVAKKYKNDDIFNSQLDINNDNMVNALTEEYKYNININDAAPKLTKYHITDVVNQLERLKHILSPIINYGVAIECKNILGYTILNSNNSIGAYKLNKQNKDTRLMYVLLSMDIFYDRRKTIDETVTNIHVGIINVLNHNFNKQTTLLKSLINKCSESLEQIQSIHKKQTIFQNTYTNLHQVVSTKDVVERVKLLSKIDCISLCIDKIMFDNIVSYNTIINNYELLIKMDKIL